MCSLQKDAFILHFCWFWMTPAIEAGPTQKLFPFWASKSSKIGDAAPAAWRVCSNTKQGRYQATELCCRIMRNRGERCHLFPYFGSYIAPNVNEENRKLDLEHLSWGVQKLWLAKCAGRKILRGIKRDGDYRWRMGEIMLKCSICKIVGLTRKKPLVNLKIRIPATLRLTLSSIILQAQR